MGDWRRVVREVLSKGYQLLPEGAKDMASRGVHGESPWQKRLVSRARDVRAGILSVNGEGDVLIGHVFRPRRAQRVESFDSWRHLEEMKASVVSSLRARSIPVFDLPNQPRPVLVIASDVWDVAWLALSQSDEMNGFSMRGKTRTTSIRSLSSSPPEDSIWVFRYLVAPAGQVLADERLRLRVLRWERVTEANIERPDGGMHEVGTLLGAGGHNSFASYLPPVVQPKLDATRSEVSWPPSLEIVTEPVDLVYTWVDGSDPLWLAKRLPYTGSSETTSDAQESSRYENRDELRFSLRSVEMFASWVNRVYLVTDAQVPRWLNVDNPQLQVVDHHELFTEDELPVFNSHAIESRLHRINGLSEKFIYINDDVFFGRPVRPESFFTGSGLFKYFPSRAHIDPGPRSAEDVSVSSAAKNNRDLLESAVGRTFSTKLKHTPHAHSRSLLEEMEDKFPELFSRNVAARFRSHQDHALLSGLAQRYGDATGRAIPAQLRYNYADISRPDLQRLLARWLRIRSYDVFCLNDTARHEVDPEQRDAVVRSFLENYFPVSSSFER